MYLFIRVKIIFKENSESRLMNCFKYQILNKMSENLLIIFGLFGSSKEIANDFIKQFI